MSFSSALMGSLLKSFPYLSLPTSQGSCISRLEDFHASAPSLLFQIYSPATLCAQKNRMRSESHKVKVSFPLQLFPSQVFLMGTLCMFKDMDREPFQGRFLRKAWLYYQTTATGWVGVITIVSSMADQCPANKKQGERKDLGIWSKRPPLRFILSTEQRDERKGEAHILTLIALYTLTLKCFTHGK